MKRTLFVFLLLLVLMSCLLYSCKEQTPTITPQTQAAITEATIVPAPETQTSDLALIESNTEEGTVSVPSVPYTLKYTVVELTNDLPSKIMDSRGLYNDYFELHYRNTYAKDGKLYIYGYEKSEKGMQGYLAVYADGEMSETIPVPMIQGVMPDYAYLLSDACFAVIWSEGGYPNELYYFGIAESDGTLRAKISLDEVYPEFWSNGDMIVSEIEDGNAVLLHRAEGTCFFSVEYDSTKQELTKGRIVFQKESNLFKHLSFMDYIGDRKWLPVWSVGECSVLNMNTGIYEDKKFRVPEDKDHMNLIADTHGNLYLFDTMGLYAYRDNLPPVKVADWIDCGVSANMYYRNLWIIDEQNFYITSSRIENNRYTNTKLYYIHTETVPDENPKQVIELDYYGEFEWLKESVIAFNRDNEAYEVSINYVDTANMNTEEIAALIADRMLNRAHPDMVLFDMRVSLQDYYDKNTFLDLAPYVGDDLLGCVRDAAEWNGKLYSVPTQMYINTFVCLPRVTRDFLTWDAFIECAQRLDDGCVLFSDRLAEKMLYENGIMDFFDLAAGTANYDSDRFRAVVRLLDSLSETYLDETAGYLTTHSDRTWGYTNPTLPARLREGGLMYLNLWIDAPEQIMMARQLFGDEEYVFCGYPSEHGGGAHIRAFGHTAILADTDVRDGCISFIKYLLSTERQTADTHEDLPVTREGIRALFDAQRYYTYSADVYLDIGNPSAHMREPAISFDTSDPIVVLSAEVISDVPIVPELDENGDPLGYCVELPQGDIDAFLYFLDNCHMSAGSDDTVEAIVTEELSYWQNGVKSLAEVTKIIQSRVSIYLAERQ
ncbi:MAG: extracellular solute-binding protein [Clostridia bacterium]|nr:extracellular solute-binding protein [Clostridia bacterium]